jgi:hypothetical protein
VPEAEPLLPLWRVGFLHLGRTPGGVYTTVRADGESAAMEAARAKFVTDFSDDEWFVVADQVEEKADA